MPLFQPNQDFIRQQAQAAQERAARRAQGNFKFHDIGKFSELYFFLLPPWSDRGALGRMVWRHFNLSVDNKMFICWKTYDILKAGMGELCPVCNALKAVEVSAGEAIERMWSKARGHVNALILGSRKLDSTGSSIGLFVPFTEEDPMAPRVLQLPQSMYDELMTQQANPQIGVVCMPDSAVAIIARRWGEGIDTKYKLEFEGNRSVSGFTPSRRPMFANPQMQETCLSRLPDLDKIWDLPGEEQATAHKIANALRAKFGVGGPTMFAPMTGPAHTQTYPAAGGYQVPQQAYVPPQAMAAPPFVPAVQTIQSPAPAPQVAPVAVQTPWDGPSGPVSEPTVFATHVAGRDHAPMAQMPAASSAPMPGVDLNRCFTEVVGPKPPANPAEPNRPICFKYFGDIQASPNKAWCDACPFKIACRMVSLKK